MPRYRMPAEFGGGILQGSASADGETVLFWIGGHSVPLSAGLVTEVRPPEPYEDWVVILEPVNTDQGPFVFHRDSKRMNAVDGKRWWSHDHHKAMTWNEVADLGETIPLVRRKTGTGICLVCKQVKSLRVDGRIKQHGSRTPAFACKGSLREAALRGRWR